MANSRSARKRVRKTITDTARNRVVRTRVKLHRKIVTAAIEAGDAGAAKEALHTFTSAVDKAASKNIVHKNSASRQKSELGKRVRALTAA